MVCSEGAWKKWLALFADDSREPLGGGGGGGGGGCRKAWREGGREGVCSFKSYYSQLGEFVGLEGALMGDHGGCAGGGVDASSLGIGGLEFTALSRQGVQLIVGRSGDN